MQVALQAVSPLFEVAVFQDPVVRVRHEAPLVSSMRVLSLRGSVTYRCRKHSLSFEASSISFLSRLTAFVLPSPYITGIKIPKMPKREYAQSSSRVVWRFFAQSNFWSVLN